MVRGMRGAISGARGAAVLAGMLAYAAARLFAAEPWPDDQEIAAKVNGQAIRVGEVRRLVVEGKKQPPAAGPARDAFLGQALELAVERRLVVVRLMREKYWPSKKEQAAALEATKAAALMEHATFEEYLTAHDLTEEALAWQTAWRWGWKRYLDDKLTDAQREAFFDAHRQEFDGTERRCRHILFKVARDAPAADWEQAQQIAKSVRAEIVAQKLDFAAAAKKHSAGPSKQQGGDLGFMTRQGAMAEEFLQAAFAVEAGEITAPVFSPFGVHLIEVTDIKPGQKGWTEVRGLLEPRVIADLFATISREERTKAKLEYTDVLPRVATAAEPSSASSTGGSER